MVAARVHEFEAAPAAVRPSAPAPACAVGQVVHDNLNRVGHELIQLVRAHKLVGHGQGNMFPGVGEGPLEVAERVGAAQGWIIGQQARGVLRDDKVTARGNGRAGRDGVGDSIGEGPPAHVNGPGGAVVQLNILIVAVAADGIVHELVDDHIRDAQGSIVPARCAGLQPVKTRRAVRETPRGNAILLRAETHRVNHAGVVRILEIDRFARRVQRKAQLRLVKGDKVLRLDDSVNGNDKPGRCRVIAQDAAGQLHWRRAVVEQLDEINVGRVCVGQKFVDDNGAIGIRPRRFGPPGRAAYDIARRPRRRDPLP